MRQIRSCVRVQSGRQTCCVRVPYGSGPQDILGHGGEVPSVGTSLLLMAVDTGGVGPQTERATLEPSERIRLSRAPHMKYEHLLGGRPRPSILL